MQHIPVWIRETREDLNRCKYWIGSPQQFVADPRIVTQTVHEETRLFVVAKSKLLTNKVLYDTKVL